MLSILGWRNFSFGHFNTNVIVSATFFTYQTLPPLNLSGNSPTFFIFSVLFSTCGGLRDVGVGGHVGGEGWKWYDFSLGMDVGTGLYLRLWLGRGCLPRVVPNRVRVPLCRS